MATADFYASIRSDCQVEGIMFSMCPFVCYQSCEHGVLKINELILMPISTNDQLWGQKVKGQGHTRVKINLSWGDIILDPLS